MSLSFFGADPVPVASYVLAWLVPVESDCNRADDAVFRFADGVVPEGAVPVVVRLDDLPGDIRFAGRDL